LFEKFHAEGLISDASLAKVGDVSIHSVFSVHWELKTLLYLGVFLLSGGLSIWIYQHLDSIDHTVIVFGIALVCVGSFGYCLRFRAPFSWGKTVSPTIFYDYILLLACLTFVTLIAYLQFQYSLFGNSLRLAGFIPLLILFPAAYYFDHLGVLSLGITNLAAWLGIVATPLGLWRSNDFSDTRLIYAGLGLGILMVLAALLSKKSGFKAHFAFTYENFGIHLLSISCLAGMFHYFNDYWPLWLLLLLGSVAWFYRRAIFERSFYFLVIISLYGYVGISTGVIRILWMINDVGAIYLGLFYFILSAIGMALFLVKENKKMKAYGRL